MNLSPIEALKKIEAMPHNQNAHTEEECPGCIARAALAYNGQDDEQLLANIKKEAYEKYPSNYATDSGYFASSKREGYIAGAMAYAASYKAGEDLEIKRLKELALSEHEERILSWSLTAIEHQREMEFFRNKNNL